MRARLLSFGMILGVAFLLIVSLVLSAVMAALGRWWSGCVRRLGGVGAESSISLLGFVVTTGGFAMIYKLMPRVKVHGATCGSAQP